MGSLTTPLEGTNADIPDASGPPNDDMTMKLVVTIPSDMHLTEAETSVSKIRPNQTAHNFSAGFHGHESVSDTSKDDPFNKFRPKVSSWRLPEGQFSSLDHYINKCC